MTTPVVFTAAVEGLADEAALRRLCRTIGADLGDVFGKSGKRSVLDRMSAYNHSARHRHWVVLVDLDNDFTCAPEAVPNWLINPASLMCFRIAVRELEAWLLADRERIAQFLRVSPNLIGETPDNLRDPKLYLINLARRSRSRAIREDIVPNERAGQSVGPAYTARMIEFITDTNTGWRPEVAAEDSPSLRRCIAALRALAVARYPAVD